MRRVAVTGMAGITALGNDWSDIREKLFGGHSAVRYMADWEQYDLHTRLAAPIPEALKANDLSRKKSRTMGPVAMLSVGASAAALSQAGLSDDPRLGAGRTGVAYGSSWGSVYH